jgi:hypothetical protein
VARESDGVTSGKVKSGEEDVVRTYRDLDVWQKACQLSIEFYCASVEGACQKP